MAIRLLRYGYEKGIRTLNNSDLRDTIVVKMPEPYLIVLEKSGTVPDVIRLQLEVPKHEKFIYNCNVLKYFEYDIKRLVYENMYLLYPLQVFKLRDKMRTIYRSSSTYEAKGRTI